MNFKVDENLPTEVAEMLQRDGHDAHTVLDEDLGGVADVGIMDTCRRESRVLITVDTDFTDIRAYPPDTSPGLIVLRLRRLDKPHVLGVIVRVMRMFKSEPLTRRLWIVEEERVRIRS